MIASPRLRSRAQRIVQYARGKRRAVQRSNPLFCIWLLGLEPTLSQIRLRASYPYVTGTCYRIDRKTRGRINSVGHWREAAKHILLSIQMARWLASWLCPETRGSVVFVGQFKFVKSQERAMANQRFLLLVFVFMAMINTGPMTEPAYTASCDAILGKWAWFTKGVVTFNPDGTMVHEPGNDGTWECTDAARGRITLRWRQGGYVNQVALSADGNGLSSTDPSQQFLTAKRIRAGGTALSGKNPSPPVAVPC